MHFFNITQLVAIATLFHHDSIRDKIMCPCTFERSDMLQVFLYRPGTSCQRFHGAAIPKGFNRGPGTSGGLNVIKLSTSVVLSPLRPLSACPLPNSLVTTDSVSNNCHCYLGSSRVAALTYNVCQRPPSDVGCLNYNTARRTDYFKSVQRVMLLL